MPTAMLFVEHELDQHEVTRTLEALAEVRADDKDPVDVVVLVPYRAHWPVGLMDDVTAARGGSASRTLDDSRRDAADGRVSARRVLDHVLSEVRQGGHLADGELVPVREEVADLVAEAAARKATTALVVASPHPLAHLLHRDLEHRLREAGLEHVVRVDGADAKAVKGGAADHGH